MEQTKHLFGEYNSKTDKKHFNSSRIKHFHIIHETIQTQQHNHKCTKGDYNPTPGCSI